MTRRSNQGNRNPWLLSEREVDVLDEVCRTGSIAEAAKRLRITKNTADSYSFKAKTKMGLKGKGALIKAVVAFDRWRQAEGRGVPA